MSVNYFPTKSSSQVQKILKSRKLEDLVIIKYLDRFLVKKRGYVFKMPPPKTPVILLYSGGLDSTIIWYMLIKAYRLNVYPLTLLRAPFSFKPFSLQTRSIRYYSKLFKSQFPRHHHPPYTVKFITPQPTIAKQTAKALLRHPKLLLDHYNPDTHQANIESLGQMSTFGLVALDYLKLLQIKHNLKVDTIFSASTSSDGLGIRHQTLTSHRLVMFNLCGSTSNFKLQFTSPAIEPGIGQFAAKSDLINYSKQEKLNLQHTFSCDRNQYLHCGYCSGCLSRQYWHQQANCQDKTLYLKQALDKAKNLFLY